MVLDESVKKHLGKVIIDEDFIILRPRYRYRTNANATLLRFEDPILLDTGTKNNPPVSNMKWALQHLSIEPASVKYIVLTHGHQDHFQNIKQYQHLFSRAKTICQQDDARFIRYPFLLSKSWGEGLLYYGLNASGLKLYRLLYGPGSNILYRSWQTPNKIDYVFQKETLLRSNHDWLRLISVPGHSDGQIIALDNRKNLYVSDLVAFTPWIEPTHESLDAMIQSLQLLQTFDESKVKRVVRAHGDIRRPNPRYWEIDSWSQEKERFQFFLDTINSTLDSIPSFLQNHPMSIQQITLKIIPNYRSYSKWMARVFIPPAITWGIAYCLHLERNGKIHSFVKNKRMFWEA